MIRFEQAVVQAQGELGVVPGQVATAIVRALDDATIDLDRLWQDSKTVGYPVLGLVRQLNTQLAESLRGHLHWGLTPKTSWTARSYSNCEKS